jgi:hypothetical protein
MARSLRSASCTHSNLPVDNVDWLEIEMAYRYALKSMDKVAIENGITLELITRKAEQEGWVKPAQNG